MSIKKTTVYDNVQASGVEARKQQQTAVKRGGQRAIIGADGTFLKVKGVQVGIEIVVDDETGELLGLDITASESAEEIEPLIREIAKQVEAEVLVSDDFDTYKNIADNADLKHQICQSHIIRNVDKTTESICKPVKSIYPPLMPKGVKSGYKQIEQDCLVLQRLVCDRPSDAKIILAALYDCYEAAPTPRPKKKHSIWYRMKRLIWKLWTRWERITLEQHYENLDGTNNACERLIGWWIKERYRTMRGYKRKLSIRNVVAITSLLGAANEPYDMGLLSRSAGLWLGSIYFTAGFSQLPNGHTCTNTAFEGTPCTLTRNSMYQAGGAMVESSGAVAVMLACGQLMTRAARRWSQNVL